MTTRTRQATTIGGHQLFAQLVALAEQDGESLYRRVTLANTLMRDRGWVEDPSGGGGTVTTAYKLLEAKCFPNVTGQLLDMADLFAILNAYPALGQWRDHDFDLRKMLALLRAREQPIPGSAPHPSRHQHPYTPPLSWAENPPGRQRRDYERLYRAVDGTSTLNERLKAENEQLRREVGALKAENAQLKHELRTLRRRQTA